MQVVALFAALFCALGGLMRYAAKISPWAGLAATIFSAAIWIWACHLDDKTAVGEDDTGD